MRTPLSPMSLSEPHFPSCFSFINIPYSLSFYHRTYVWHTYDNDFLPTIHRQFLEVLCSQSFAITIVVSDFLTSASQLERLLFDTDYEISLFTVGQKV